MIYNTYVFGCRYYAIILLFLPTTLPIILIIFASILVNGPEHFPFPYSRKQISAHTFLIFTTLRLKTFARYGLQQIQVDCHYLHLYLWRFVEDEAVVTHLLDEIMSSALLRSLDQPPVLMEPSVVEVICDKV